MSDKRILRTALVASVACGLALGLSAGGAVAQVKVGIIAHFSGPFAAGGNQYKRAIQTFVQLHGNKAGGQPIEFLYRDLGGPNPARAKQLAEELVVRDHVSVIGGFQLSPEATAVAPVATETSTPTVIFNGSDSFIPSQSPFFVRVGVPTYTEVEAQVRFALKHNKKRFYISVADYSNGYATETATKLLLAKYGAGNGVVGVDHVPLNSVDFSPFAERIANAKPDMVFIFIGIGAPGVNYLKALAAQGVLGPNSKTWVIGTGETDDPDLKLFSDSVVGFYSALPYALDLTNKENEAFKPVYEKIAGEVPGGFALFAYDGIQVIYHMIEAQKGGKFDPKVAMASARGYSWDSPRGPLKIEAETRDITENVYIRRIEEVNGKLRNVLVDTFPQIKDPWPSMGRPK